MKKLLLLILVLGLVLPSVLSWSAVRTISGNDVTITVDDAGTNGYIIKENIPAGLTVTSASSGGYINTAKGYIKWTFTYNPAGKVFTYTTTGSGTVSGVMSAGEPASEKVIGGDTLVSPPATGGGGAAPNSADDAIDQLTQQIGNEIKSSKDTTGKPQPSLSLFSKIAKLVRDFFFG